MNKRKQATLKEIYYKISNMPLKSKLPRISEFSFYKNGICAVSNGKMDTVANVHKKLEEQFLMGRGDYLLFFCVNGKHIGVSDIEYDESDVYEFAEVQKTIKRIGIKYSDNYYWFIYQRLLEMLSHGMRLRADLEGEEEAEHYFQERLLQTGYLSYYLDKLVPVCGFLFGDLQREYSDYNLVKDGKLIKHSDILFDEEIDEWINSNRCICLAYMDLYGNDGYGLLGGGAIENIVR